MTAGPRPSWATYSRKSAAIAPTDGSSDQGDLPWLRRSTEKAGLSPSFALHAFISVRKFPLEPKRPCTKTKGGEASSPSLRELALVLVLELELVLVLVLELVLLLIECRATGCGWSSGKEAAPVLKAMWQQAAATRLSEARHHCREQANIVQNKQKQHIAFSERLLSFSPGPLALFSVLRYVQIAKLG
jgi:hypothetical protein